MSWFTDEDSARLNQLNFGLSSVVESGLRGFKIEGARGLTARGREIVVGFAVMGEAVYG